MLLYTVQLLKLNNKMKIIYSMKIIYCTLIRQGPTGRDKGDFLKVLKNMLVQEQSYVIKFDELVISLKKEKYKTK